VADPAIQAALEAVLAAVAATDPTIDTVQRFTRKNDTAPAATRAGKRLFDFRFNALSDESNAGRGVQTVGKADRIATIAIRIDYPVGRAQKALETVLALDAEQLLRMLHRSSTWVNTPVRRVVAGASMDRSRESVITEDGETPGVLVLVITAAIQYRDSE
jgi:hypothetical protein